MFDVVRLVVVCGSSVKGAVLRHHREGIQVILKCMNTNIKPDEIYTSQKYTYDTRYG